jgi:hypothetical protein
MEIKQKKLPENRKKKSFAYRKASAGRVLSHAAVAVTPVIDSQEESGNYSALPPPCARPSTLQSSNCFAYLPIPLAQLDTFNARKKQAETHLFGFKRRGSDAIYARTFFLEPARVCKIFLFIFSARRGKNKRRKVFSTARAARLFGNINNEMSLAGRSQSEGRAASAVRKGFSLESWHGLVFAVSDDGREAHKKKTPTKNV